MLFFERDVFERDKIKIGGECEIGGESAQKNMCLKEGADSEWKNKKLWSHDKLSRKKNI